MLIRRSNRLCSINSQIQWNSRRSVNSRIAKSGKLKLERFLNSVGEKLNNLELELQKKAKIKQSISSALDILEGEDVFRKRQEILNKSYLESISEIILYHPNFEKIPRLNINNIEVNPKLLHVKIFWNFTENDPNKIEEYTLLLNEMIPDIQSKLRHNYYRNNPPGITFVYDLSDGLNNKMESIFNNIGKETLKVEKEPFDPSKLFEKEKLIKKEFDIKSLVVRDPRVDFPYDEKNPTKFRHPYEMNLFIYNLDFKKIYENILIQVSQGKSKRTLGKTQFVNETMPSPFVTPQIFKESDLKKDEFELPLTEERIHLMKKFVIASKKKLQRQSRVLKREMFDRLDEDLDKNLEAKERMDEKYKSEEAF